MSNTLASHISAVDLDRAPVMYVCIYYIYIIIHTYVYTYVCACTHTYIYTQGGNRVGATH
jgi:hypothetical protein